MSMAKEIQRRAAVLRDLARSGLTMAEYCRRAGLSYGAVAAWRCAQRREAARFIEVEEVEGSVAAPGRREAGLEMLCADLALPGGAVLRIYSGGAEGGAR